MPDREQRRRFYKASAVLSHTRDRLLSRARLAAVGVGLKATEGEITDEPCIKTFVWRKLPVELVPPDLVVPGEVFTAAGKVRTDVDAMMLPTGPPWLHLAEGGRGPNWFRNQARRRPFSGGDSISHPITPLGTVATEVIDPHNPGARYILSCNHVLAALNRAAIGDTVLQPAFADGGRASFDACGFVDRYVPIRFWPQGGNRVDAAVARVNPRDVIPFVDWVGVPAGTRAGNSMSPGERVFKTGRTTLLNSGQVVAVNVSGWIYYPAFFGGFSPAFFEEQIITSGMAGFGDSGSLLFDEDRNAVGLLFGGSPTHTFFNDIAEVERELRVKIAVN